MVAFSSFEEIVIGDCNVDAARKLAEEMSDARVRAVKADANDYDGLVKLFKGFDLVVNGLPFKYDLAVTKACIEAGVNGLDVSTEESQWTYDTAARDKGIIFVPGVGATPGITNVMARRAADQMEVLDEIRIHFAAFRCIAPAAGLLTTFLWEFDPHLEKERLVYENGRFRSVGPFEGLKMVNFPGPIGEQEVCYIPHPETVTLPESLGAKKVSVQGCFPPQAMRLAKALLDHGFYGGKPLSVKGIQATPLEIMHELLIQLPESKQTPLWAYGLLVEAYGNRDGRDVKITLWNRHPPQDEWGGTAAYYKNIGIPLSIGAEMIGRGEVTHRGVIPPETAYDPQAFFTALARRRIEIHEKIEEYHKLA
jgi:saccharopine dehydrogenase-like NADP-dependent oxidoreductase